MSPIKKLGAASFACRKSPDASVPLLTALLPKAGRLKRDMGVVFPHPTERKDYGEEDA
ncbi:MAG: hypothetical protein ACM32G_07665 [Betaproteobacteria bacterium]|jgi:hypothetical protein